MASITLSTEHWPIVVTQFDGEQTSEELEAYIRDFDARVYARGEPFLGLVLMKRYANRFEHIQRIGRWSRESDPLTQKFCKGIAMVAESIAFRAVFSLVQLVHKMSVPYRLCRTGAEALGYLGEIARRNELAVPADVQALSGPAPVQPA